MNQKNNILHNDIKKYLAFLQYEKNLSTNTINAYWLDLKSYIDNQGMLYNYGSVFPGQLNLTFESFLSDLQKTMNGGFNEKQAQVKRLFHKYTNGKNSQRVCDCLLDAL